MAEGPEFRLMLCGDSNVGKTSLLRRHLTGEYTEVYEPTISTEIHTLRFETNCGPVTFHVWDTRGEEKRCVLHNKDFAWGDCAILMFDVTVRLTYKSIPVRYDDIKKVCGRIIPISLLGNKADLVKSRRVKAEKIQFHRKKSMQYYDISTSSRLNIDMPFLWLAKRLTDQPDLEFLHTTQVAPQMTRVLIPKLEQDLEDVANAFIDCDSSESASSRSSATDAAEVRDLMALKDKVQYELELAQNACIIDDDDEDEDGEEAG